MTQQKTSNNFEPTEEKNKIGSHIVFTKLCKGCGICVEICPKKCLKPDKEKSGVYNNPVAKVDINKCIFCGQCELRCPDSAIKVEIMKNNPSSEIKKASEEQEKRTDALIEILENPVRVEGVVSRSHVEEQIETAIALFLNKEKEKVKPEVETTRGRVLESGEDRAATEQIGIITVKRELSEELITSAAFTENGEKRILVMISDVDNARRLNNRLKNRSTANEKISGICNSAVRLISNLDGDMTDEKPLSSRLEFILEKMSVELGEMIIPEDELSVKYKKGLIEDHGEEVAKRIIAENDSVGKMLEGSISMGLVVVGEEDITAIAKKLTETGVEETDLQKAIKSELLSRADKALKIAKGRKQLVTDNNDLVSGTKSTFAVWRMEEDSENSGKRREFVSLRKAGKFYRGQVEQKEIEGRARVIYELEENGETKQVELKKIIGHVGPEEKDMEDESFGVYKAEYLKQVIDIYSGSATVVPFEIGFSTLNALLGYAETDKILLAMANELSTLFGKETGFKIIKAGAIMVLVGPKGSEVNIKAKCSLAARNLLKRVKIVRENKKESLHDFLIRNDASNFGTTGFFFENAEVGTDEKGNLLVEKYVLGRTEIPVLAFKE